MTAAPRPRTCPACRRTPSSARPTACVRCGPTPTASSSPAPATAEADDAVVHTAEVINQRASAYLAAAHGSTPGVALLSQLNDFMPLLQDSEAAVIHRSRLQGDSWQVLAEPLGVSPERLRKRWRAASLERRLERLRSARSRTLAATLTPGAPPSQTPAQQLAAALSFLQRGTGRTLAQCAAEMEISPSYVSRVLSGARRPSWNVVLRFAQVCGGHEPELRDLWEAAQRPPTPGNPGRDRTSNGQADARQKLHTALRALFLASGCPSPEHLRHRTGDTLTAEEIHQVLTDAILPDWHRTSRLIFALRGRPAELQPLWLAATAPHPTPPHR
ncbi:helix-turn-helix domain-containing protein [Streptomyces sp. NPDC048606]|uniref:helix-turn-helix domain-containing protein n=1 Tax=Streptomyces sp. NPDC048606 TaxID=3154726 RepID=UPI0034364072